MRGNYGKNTCKQASPSSKWLRHWASTVRTCRISSNNWLNGLRIEEAKKRMLTDRRLPMSTLAAMVGFTDLAHFSKQFKLKEGIAPTYWLQKQPKLKPVSGN